VLPAVGMHQVGVGLQVHVKNLHGCVHNHQQRRSMQHTREHGQTETPCAHLDDASELLEVGEGVVRHGVDLGALPVTSLAAAGGCAHLGPAPVVGQGLVDVASGARLQHAARGNSCRRTLVGLAEGRSAGEAFTWAQERT